MLYHAPSGTRLRSPVLYRAAQALFLAVLAAATLFGQPAQQRSEEEQAADLERRVIETLQVREGQTVADVGCGDGFYTIPLARAIGPSGKVFAVDIDDAALSKLRDRIADQSIKNVEIIKGKEEDPLLPLGALDAVMIVNAYHEMAAHEVMLRHVRAALKPGGIFVLMEGVWDSREKQPRDEQTKHHQLAAGIARQELEVGGFKVVSLRDPFVERTPDEDGKSRWWLIVARRPDERQ
jgi:predicted methyltransferase